MAMKNIFRRDQGIGTAKLREGRYYVKMFKSMQVCLMVLAILGVLVIMGCTPTGDEPLIPGDPPNPNGVGPAPVNLRTAAAFAVLSKTGVSSVPASVITGDVGVSPYAESYLTGFSQTDFIGYATSPQVTGFLYAADMAPPTPTKMTTTVSDMETAYTDAAGRTTPAFTNLGAGEIGGLTLVPGLYVWGTALAISTDVTISGGVNDVWIFQVAENLTVANGKSVILSGGAQAKNIFWQIGSSVAIGTTSHIEGTILSMTEIVMDTGSSINGRALSQSAVTLAQATVIKPAN